MRNRNLPRPYQQMIKASRNAGFLLLILCVPGSCLPASAQEPATETTVADRDRGIDLYKQGKTQAAIKILKEVVKNHSDDADAWYFLGLAYYGDASIWLASVAFEHLLALRPASADANAKFSYGLILANQPKLATAAALRAIELGDQSAEPHYAIAEASFRASEYPNAIEEANKVLQIKPDFAPALITKSLAHYSLKQYGEAAASLERFLAINPGDPDAGVWREQMDRLRTFDRRLTGSTAVTQPAADLPLTGREVTQKARVLDKPEPTYTEAARKAGVTGTVVMRCVFGSDGQVRSLVMIRALGYGLTARAAQAARRIKFTPATKDGKQVSMWIELQYNFNLF